MRFWLIGIVLAGGLVMGAGNCGEVTGVERGEVPEWVESVEVPVGETPEGDRSYGFDWLLFDSQVNVERGEAFVRSVYRVTTVDALQSGGRVTWNFDPSFEKVVVHHVRLIRKGVAQDRLKLEEVQVIQQEKDWDRHLYDGRLTAFLLLKDVQVGDVVDVAYTQSGENPVLEGKGGYQFSLGHGYPLRWERLRVVEPPGRRFFYRMLGGVEVPVLEWRRVELPGGGADVRWEGRELRPVKFEADAPGWLRQYATVQVGEFEDWGGVVKWVEKLYRLPEELPAAVAEKARELVKAGMSEEEKGAALLDFVQQEVRYLGIELGVGSYRPTAPEVVIERRFGDCKDKSLLYCAMMRAVGLRAWPVLVHTTMGEELSEEAPFARAFDHVIACVATGDGRGGEKLVFVDPTLVHQAGGLMKRALPDYRKGLVVRAGESGLRKIGDGGLLRTVKWEELYVSGSFEEAARVRLKASYGGLGADGTRAFVRQNTAEDVGKYFLGEYAAVYPGAELVGEVKWSDDRGENVFSVEGEFLLKNFWVKGPDGKRLEADVFPRVVYNSVQGTALAARRTPLGLGERMRVEVRSVVELPEAWEVSPKDLDFEGAGFRGRVEQGLEEGKRRLEMRHSWETVSDAVAAVEVPRYLEAAKRFREALGIKLTYTPMSGVAGTNGVVAKFRVNWLFVLIAVVVTWASWRVCGILWGMKAAGPPVLPGTEGAGLSGLGGWLVLVGIGLVARPFLLLAAFPVGVLPGFNFAIWESATTVGSASYQPWLGTLLAVEMAMNLLMFFGSVFLVVLFFAKKRAFAGVFVAVTLFMVACVIFEGVFVGMLIDTKEGAEAGVATMKGIVQMVVYAGIWVPYVLVSRRVRNTFRR